MTSYSPFSLDGKAVLVTGASSGIGAVTAVECSKMGASVIITGRNEERLAMTFSRLNTASATNHQMIVADLTKESDITSLLERINHLDGLVNNAGVNLVKPVTFIKQDDIDYVFRSNTWTAVTLTRSLLKKKKLNKNGSIVFTSSVSAFYNAPGRSLYAGSKAALTSFMRSFAVELAAKGIRANSVHPGLVETNMMKENLSDEELAQNLKEYPLNRFGKPEDIAWAIIYLLSDASSWVTGTSLVVDGGFMLK